MPTSLASDPWGYLLQFENHDVTVYLKNKTTVTGYVDIVDDDDSFDRSEPSLTVLSSGTPHLIFSGDIDYVKALDQTLAIW